jgi:hypothetical protein
VKKKYIPAAVFCLFCFPALSATVKPVRILSFHDSLSLYTPGTLNPEDFEDCTDYVNSGFHDGNLWLLMTVPAAYLQAALNFSNEYVSRIDLYRKDNGTWTFCGQAGRYLPRKLRPFSTWRNAIPVYFSAADSAEHEFLACIRSQPFTGFHITLRPLAEFHDTTIRLTILLSAVYGCFIMLLVNMLISAAYFRNRKMMLLAAAFTFGILTLLSFCGLGPVYLWNFLAGIPNMYRVLKLFPVGGFFFLNLFFRESKKKTKLLNFLYYCAAGSAAAELFSIFFIPSDKIAFTVFLACAVLVFGSFSGMSACRSATAPAAESRTLPEKIITGILILVTIRVIFHLARGVSSAGIFRIFDNDFYALYYILLDIFVFPAVFRPNRKLRTELAQLEIRQSEVDERIKKSQDCIYTYSCITDLMTEPLQQIHTIADRRLAFTGQTAILLAASSKEALILAHILRILGNCEAGVLTIHDASEPVAIKQVFKTAVSDVVDFGRERETRFAVKYLIAEDLVLLADPLLLSFLFRRLLMTIIEITPRDTRIIIVLRYTDGIFQYSVKNEGLPVSPDEMECIKNPEQIQKNGYDWKTMLHIISRISELYNGLLDINTSTGGNIFSMILELPRQNDSEKSEQKPDGGTLFDMQGNPLN